MTRDAQADLARNVRAHLGIGLEGLEGVQAAEATGTEEALRAELGGMKLDALLRRARAAGVGEAALEAALDHDAPKRAVAELIARRHDVRPPRTALPVQDIEGATAGAKAPLKSVSEKSSNWQAQPSETSGRASKMSTEAVAIAFGVMDSYNDPTLDYSTMGRALAAAGDMPRAVATTLAACRHDPATTRHFRFLAVVYMQAAAGAEQGTAALLAKAKRVFDHASALAPGQKQLAQDRKELERRTRASSFAGPASRGAAPSERAAIHRGLLCQTGVGQHA